MGSCNVPKFVVGTQPGTLLFLRSSPERGLLKSPREQRALALTSDSGDRSGFSQAQGEVPSLAA